MVVRFNVRNPRAEQWAARQSSRLITEVIEETKAISRDVIRRGIEAGQNPRDTLRGIVGTLNRATGRREGGILGLTTQQAGWVQNALDELTSGDPAMMRRYLDRQARSKTFDRIVARAIREGRALTQDEARKITNGYAQKLLRYRGEVISRTETLTSLHAAQHEALTQMVESGKVDASAIKRTWDATADKFTRDSHLHMEGQTVGLNQPFRTQEGYQMMYPGDTSLGAPGSETIQCRCRVVVKIDRFARFRSRGR